MIVTVLDLLLDLDSQLGDPSKVSGFDLQTFAVRIHRVKCRFTEPTSGGWYEHHGGTPRATDAS